MSLLHWLISSFVLMFGFQIVTLLWEVGVQGGGWVKEYSIYLLTEPSYYTTLKTTVLSINRALFTSPCYFFKKKLI